MEDMCMLLRKTHKEEYTQSKLRKTHKEEYTVKVNSRGQFQGEKWDSLLQTDEGGWERDGRCVADTVATHVRNISIGTKQVSREAKDSAEQPIKHTDHQ